MTLRWLLDADDLSPGEALCWDEARQRWLWFRGPGRELSADHAPDCRAVLAAAERHALEGGWAVGFVAYDSGPAWDPAIGARRRPGCPLAAFALYDSDPVEVRFLGAWRLANRPDWQPEIARAEYVRLFEGVRRRLEAGDTYQANLTFRLRSRWTGNLAGWFASVAGPEPPWHAAWLDLAGVQIASLSPELFLERSGRTVRCRPMKGTGTKGADADAIRGSEKQRAENLMIVDMVRNDLGRVAAPGGVRVPALFTIEHHGEVLQMTSTVEADTDADLVSLFRAAFPCASIVGAPKVETTRILAALEPSPRGVYTGAVGWIAPGGDFRFNVAIRTAVRYPDGSLEYGTGGGIVWDSDPESEWSEALLKTSVLDRRLEPFALLQTVRWEPVRGFVRLEAHLRRLELSCRELGWRSDPDTWKAALSDAEARWSGGDGPLRVRFLLHPGGKLEVQQRPLVPPQEPLRARPALRPVRSDDPALQVKTTYRSVYRARLAEVGECDECLLWNERGEATEFCNGNLAALRDGRWVTPPLSCGVLPGVLREQLLARGELTEAVIPLEEALAASEVVRLNSLTGRLRVRLDR
ncbi:MAG: chorismate-binding protein [Fimbriimonadales bacterium]